MVPRLLLTGLIVLCICLSTATAGEPLKIGVAAMVSPKETVRYYKQLIDYIAAKLGSPVEMVQKESYDDMDGMLERGQVQLAFVCSGPYVKDREKFGVELLVAPQSHGKPFYHAYIIVHRDSTIKDLAGLQGKKFAFTDPKSNTGALVPSYMIAKEFKVKPEKFFGEVVYTRSHDRSIEAVAKKFIDAASVDSLIYDYAVQKDPLYTSLTRIITRSPPYGIPPLVATKRVDPGLKNRIKKLLLNMHADPEGKAILDGIMVDKFIVPIDSDYDSVRTMSDWVSMMK